MTDSTPADDGEPTSLREKAKEWAEEHPRATRFVKVAGATVGMVAVALLASGGMAEDEGEFPSHAGGSADAEDAAEVERTEGAEHADSAADSAEEGAQRKSPDKHNVVPHKRRLKDGRKIDVSGYERGGSSKGEGGDKDEDPGEAAA